METIPSPHRYQVMSVYVFVGDNVRCILRYEYDHTQDTDDKHVCMHVRTHTCMYGLSYERLCLLVIMCDVSPAVMRCCGAVESHCIVLVSVWVLCR